MLILPTLSGRITSDYGLRKHPILKRTILHKGVDFKARANEPLFSVSEGVVESAGPRGSFGNVVQIYFPAQKLSGLYAHLNRTSVAAGQKVEAGQKIGLAGSTGRSTGPHLHFEMRTKGSKTVNPERHLATAQARFHALSNSNRKKMASSQGLQPSLAHTMVSEAITTKKGIVSATSEDPLAFIFAPAMAFIQGLLS